MATISASDQKKLNDYTAAWHAANARGDKAAMDAAHKGAEAVRAGYGYSGGSDGTQNIKISTPTTTTSTNKSSGGSSGKTYTSTASNTGIRYTNVSGGGSSGGSSGSSSSGSRGSGSVTTPATGGSVDYSKYANNNPVNAGNYPQSMDYYMNLYNNAASSAEKQHWGQVIAAKQSQGGTSGTTGTYSSGNVYNAITNGNAPDNAQIGDLIITAGGNYRIVAPGTAGANYNPSNGRWSILESPAGGTVGAGTTQQPIRTQGTYFDAGAHASGVPGGYGDQMDSNTAAWWAAYYANDQQGMANAHARQEALRNQLGYSGGNDGTAYIPIQMEQDILPKVVLPTYQPQKEEVNNVYDAAKEQAMAALRAAYESSKLELDRYAAQIPGIYQERANQLAAQAAKERQQLNEYSAYQGLNAGSGSQAALALSNQMQNTMGQIRTAEANATAEAQYQLSALYTEYQGKIASAIANNEYERAAALLAEYKEAQQSIVSVAQAQANLDMNIANFNKDTRFTNWQKQMALAEAMAANGDFSGYGALGLSNDQTNSMRRGWLALNPEAAIAMGLGGYR